MRTPLVCVLTSLALAGCAAASDETVEESELAATSGMPGPAGCPGLWENTPDYRGLRGRWARLAPMHARAGEPVAVVFETQTAADPVRDTGRSTRQVRAASGYTVARGRYTALVDNPAIGAALGFVDEGVPEGTQETYFVAGTRRSVTGALTELCLLSPYATDGAGFVLKKSRFR